MIPFGREPILSAPLLPSNVEHTDAVIYNALKRMKYPVLASIKKDGIRAVRLNGTLMSRTIKEIPNVSIRRRSLCMPGGMDMELCNDDLDFYEVESIVMSREHKDSDKIEFYLLDWYQPEVGYMRRIHDMFKWWQGNKFNFDIVCESPAVCTDADALMQFFLDVEKQKGEGICFRTLQSPYKFGRSTLKEQYLVKLCRFVTAEAEIIGIKEAISEADIPKGILGAFVCRTMDGVEFKIGTGFNMKQRNEYFTDKVIGKTVTFKCKKFGEKVKPRSPVFKGFRTEGY